MKSSAIGIDAKAMRELSLRHPTATALLMFMIQKMGKDNRLSMSQGKIAEAMEVTRRSVNQAIRTLQQLNLISVTNSANELVYSVHDASAPP